MEFAGFSALAAESSVHVAGRLRGQSRVASGSLFYENLRTGGFTTLLEACPENRSFDAMCTGERSDSIDSEKR